ncbi:MAG: cell division protein FtsA [Candidatus Thioglobus sp.]|nr:cell division protein FtsA [Candidatus Thioglobus pontius]MBL6985299.1 cell division protein FtsA [Candidatus Thioglobus sp.]
MSDREFFAGIDLGSSKIVMLIAEIEQDKIHVFAHASGESAGVKNGVVTNQDQATKAVRAVIDKIKRTCKERVINVSVNINDLHLNSNNQNRPISFSRKSTTVSKEDVAKAIQNSSAGAVATNKKQLKAIVNGFTIDDQVVDQPIGLEAQILGADVHLISVSNQALNGVINCLSECDLGIDTVMADSIASSAVCITDEQKKEGACLLDMGASVSNISVFTKGGVTFSHVFKFGGDTVTEAISQAYNTSFEEAERLKLAYGILQPNASLKDCLVEFEQINSNEKYYLSLHELISVIEKSYQEICGMIKKRLKAEKLDRALKAGIVVIGGASKIENCESFLLKEFRIRTKLAKINRTLVSGNEDLLTDIGYFSAFGLLTCNTVEPYLQETESVQKNGLLGKMKGLLEL